MTPSRESEVPGERRLRLVFMGTPEFGAVCLQRILEGPHEVVAVVTQADRPAGRGHKLKPSAVKELAVEHGIDVLQPASARDGELAAHLQSIAPDLGVVVAYGKILPRKVIDAPRLGCINAHGSLLPALRGAAPIERAILEGLDETGVTIIRINERMDAGDMLGARTLAIPARCDGGTLRTMLAPVAADLLADVIDELAAGRARAEPQDERLVTHAPPIDKAEAEIDWTRTAAEVDRKVRAFHPRPGAFTFHDDRRLKIVAGEPTPGAPEEGAGTVSADDAGNVTVACSDGGFRLETVQPEGRKAMSAADYLRGRGGGNRLGRRSGNH